MKDNVVEVRIWDKTVGVLSWDEKRGCSVFQFDKDFSQYGLNIAPLTAPLDSSYLQKAFPMSGNKEKLYAGLPEFVADSLPDHWGNVVFQKWLEANHFRSTQINSVDRLSFIGKRAMGALEFQPAHILEDASVNIELTSLYELANKIFMDRQDVAIDISNSLIMEDLYKVGTSAGGQRPKAIIAIDDETGVVRSGQADLPANFKHYILKFDISKPNDFPFTKVEMAYYLMAKDAGIDMNEEGEWRLSPAYDMIFSADPDSRFYRNHELSILGKRNNITRKDMLLFAQRQDIKNAANIIDEVVEVVAKFKGYAENVGISDHWIKKIDKVLKENF